MRFVRRRRLAFVRRLARRPLVARIQLVAVAVVGHKVGLFAAAAAAGRDSAGARRRAAANRRAAVAAAAAVVARTRLGRARQVPPRHARLRIVVVLAPVRRFVLDPVVDQLGLRRLGRRRRPAQPLFALALPPLFALALLPLALFPLAPLALFPLALFSLAPLALFSLPLFAFASISIGATIASRAAAGRRTWSAWRRRRLFCRSQQSSR